MGSIVRNDALDDPKHLPPLRAEQDPIGRYPSTPAAPAGHAGLWFLLLLLTAALAGAAWWGQFSIEQLERQLVATQDSFARVAEEAAERQQASANRLEHLEDLPRIDRQALEERLARLEQHAATPASPPGSDELHSALEPVLVAQQQRLEVLTQQHGSQQERQQTQQIQLESLSTQVTQLEQAQLQWRAAQEEQYRQQQQALSSLTERVATLRATESPETAAIRRLEQELLVLRSGLERPTPAPKASASISQQEFDLFRAQTTRHITALQGQIANLQQQLDKPH